ncbi:hypothetical protein FKK16_16400 [Klebsiella pneumoniae]|uniref:hypothetical protein n=1 Tax=Klebsiella pneumoniae TaxID=573 RepID=UPI001EBAD6B1|nr:hypothetical protein [Klebsiella pneumoniae]MBK3097877.1 hypothetical protein [Klebsiella pneumoniae]MCP8922376.1 hypothetical protein [Klebsiella pneumoniae]MCP8933827.1 hypothetical protein [Klebsiella pneumoniae]MCP8989109.1 hypothetical protein [Klebsiella pneumoniae]MCP9027531.1 hypothetical protein [Klebsiella pneumoniae]
MGKIIADYQATKDGEVIYSGTLVVESDDNDASVKEAVSVELNNINTQYGGGVPESIFVNSYINI